MLAPAKFFFLGELGSLITSDIAISALVLSAIGLDNIAALVWSIADKDASGGTVFERTILLALILVLVEGASRQRNSKVSHGWLDTVPLLGRRGGRTCSCVHHVPDSNKHVACIFPHGR